MARCLSSVEYTFILEGRNQLVLLPGIVPQGDEEFGAGDVILLRRPDGVIIEKPIASLELMYPLPSSGAVAVLVEGLRQQDVPVGTQVWSID
jgi:hypothetical protein